MNLDDRKAAVYRHLDAQGRLLYVGIAVDIEHRWTWHKRNSIWWSDIQQQTVDWYPNRRQAARAERHAIRDENPTHNIAGIGFPNAQTRTTTRAAPRPTSRAVPWTAFLASGDSSLDALRRALPNPDRSRARRQVPRD